MRAPRCDRSDKSSHRVRGVWGALLGLGPPAERVRLRTVNLYYGPHLTTRFAACSHVASLSGPASSHPVGTGASRRFSPSLSKQSQPLLNSVATTTLRRNGLLRRSLDPRRSANPSNVSAVPAELARRSAFLRSAAAGVTSHTSHRLPLESRKVLYPTLTPPPLLFASRSQPTPWFARRVPMSEGTRHEIHQTFTANVRICADQRASNFLPASRRSKFRSALKTRK